jgi:predicted RNA-binding Zn-ribbon protein involved in translation (DUF1610 family)
MKEDKVFTAEELEGIAGGYDLVEFTVIVSCSACGYEETVTEIERFRTIAINDYRCPNCRGEKPLDIRKG